MQRSETVICLVGSFRQAYKCSEINGKTRHWGIRIEGRGCYPGWSLSKYCLKK